MKLLAHIGSSLPLSFLIGLSALQCGKEDSLFLQRHAHLHMDFEKSNEPLQSLPDRPANPGAVSNGCMEGVAWNEYYTFDVCLSTTSQMSDYAIERSSDHARIGQNALRVFLKPTALDQWPLGEATHRAELRPNENSPYRRYPREGEERWYGFSVFFPDNFVFAPSHLASDLRFSLAQWQHGSEGSPIFAFEVYGDQLAVARSAGISTDTEWVPPHYIKTIQRGKWMDLAVKVIWSKTSGEISIWVDGESRYNRQGIQTIYHNLENGGGFKFGLYYWRWQSQESVQNSLNAGITFRELYFDEIREYLGTEGLPIVTPGKSR